MVGKHKTEMPKKIILDITVGCADSRDEPLVLFDAKENVLAQYKEQRIHVDFLRINEAGNFITDQVFADLKRLISSKINHYTLTNQKAPIEININIAGHGAVQLREGADPAAHAYYDVVALANGSKVECGMKHAKDVAREFEIELLPDERSGTKSFEIKKIDGSSKIIKIENEDSIKALLDAIYGQRERMVGGWIKSVDQDICSHVLEQARELREKIDADFEMRNWRIRIAAGVQNYHENTFCRVDNNRFETPFSMIYQEIGRLLHDSVYAEDIAARREKQGELEGLPLKGLIHHPDVGNARLTAAQHQGLDFMAGRFFAIGSYSVDNCTSPFDKYDLLAFYYGAKVLGITDWAIEGTSKRQVKSIRAKIKNDPLMSYIKEKYRVKFDEIVSKGMTRGKIMEKKSKDVTREMEKKRDPEDSKLPLMEQLVEKKTLPKPSARKIETKPGQPSGKVKLS